MLDVKKLVLLLSAQIVLGTIQYSWCLNTNKVDIRQGVTKQNNNLTVPRDIEDLDEESNEEAIQSNKSNIRPWLGIGAVGFGVSFLVYRIIQCTNNSDRQKTTTSHNNENERLNRSVVLRTIGDILPDLAYNDNLNVVVHDTCSMCMQGNVPLVELHGQFMCCRDCMLAQVLNIYQTQRANLHNIPCPFHDDCRQQLSLQDYAIITRGNQVIAATFEAARLNAQNPGQIDLNNIDPRDAQYLLANSVECPGCHVRIQRTEGCNHMTCNRCPRQFCYICLRDWAIGSGPNAHTDHFNCRFIPGDHRNRNPSEAQQ